LEGLRQIFEREGEEIACVILEPVAGNMGVVLPEDGFLPGVRRLTEEYGAGTICPVSSGNVGTGRLPGPQSV